MAKAKKDQTAEVAETTAEVAEPTKPAKPTAAFSYKSVKPVTLPLLKKTLEQPLFLRMEGPVFLGKALAKGKGQTDDKGELRKPAHLCNVVNLETGELCQIIVEAVLQGIFADEYPNDAQVGKCFRIVKHAKASGKDYHTFTVEEIEPA